MKFECIILEIKTRYYQSDGIEEYALGYDYCMLALI